MIDEDNIPLVDDFRYYVALYSQFVFYLNLFDIFSVRNAGDEWLVTSEDTEMYIPEVSEVKQTMM